MKRISRYCLAALLFVGLFPALVKSQDPSMAKGKDEYDIIGIGRRLKGRLVDYTSNHGHDNRMWSKALRQWRDLYVYLPPGYTKTERYPIMIYLHPFALDERTFLRLIPAIDEAIASGATLPEGAPATEAGGASLIGTFTATLAAVDASCACAG